MIKTDTGAEMTNLSNFPSDLDLLFRTPKTPKSLSKNNSAWSNYHDEPTVIETTTQFRKELAFDSRLALPKLEIFNHGNTL